MCSSICNQIRAVFASIGTGFSQLAHRISALVRGLFACMGCSAREAAPLNPQRVSSPDNTSVGITDAVARPVLTPHAPAAEPLDVPIQPQSAPSPAASEPLFSFNPTMVNCSAWIHLERQKHRLTTAASESINQLENWKGSSEDFLNHINRLAHTFETCNRKITDFYRTHIRDNCDPQTQKWKQGPHAKTVADYVLEDLIYLDTFRDYHRFWIQLKAFDRDKDISLALLNTFINMPLPVHFPDGLAQTIGRDIKEGLFEFILNSYTWMLKKNKISAADNLKARIETLCLLFHYSKPTIPSYDHIFHLATFYEHLSVVENAQNKQELKLRRILDIQHLMTSVDFNLFEAAGLCRTIFGRCFASSMESFAQQLGPDCPDDLVDFVSTLCQNLRLSNRGIDSLVNV